MEEEEVVGAGKVSYSLYIAQEARDVFKIILLLLLSLASNRKWVLHLPILKIVE